MLTYKAPARDLRFVYYELFDARELTRLPGFEDATPDVVEAVLEEIGKIASEVLALERSAFMRLIRTKPSLARVEHMLETGKPLRN